ATAADRTLITNDTDFFFGQANVHGTIVLWGSVQGRNDRRVLFRSLKKRDKKAAILSLFQDHLEDMQSPFLITARIRSERERVLATLSRNTDENGTQVTTWTFTQPTPEDLVKFSVRREQKALERRMKNARNTAQPASNSTDPLVQSPEEDVPSPQTAENRSPPDASASGVRGGSSDEAHNIQSCSAGTGSPTPPPDLSFDVAQSEAGHTPKKALTEDGTSKMALTEDGTPKKALTEDGTPKEAPTEDANGTQKKAPTEDVNGTPKKALTEDADDTPKKALTEDANDTPKEALTEGANDTPKEALTEDANDTPKKALTEDVNDTSKKTPTEDDNGTTKKALTEDDNGTTKKTLTEDANDTTKKAPTEDANDTPKKTPTEDVNGTLKKALNGSNTATVVNTSKKVRKEEVHGNNTVPHAIAV
ncbi:hypothetical protein BC936DRAFT_137850, partial [Jimgerdemannia flammicorona]